MNIKKKVILALMLNIGAIVLILLPSGRSQARLHTSSIQFPIENTIIKADENNLSEAITFTKAILKEYYSNAGYTDGYTISHTNLRYTVDGEFSPKDNGNYQKFHVVFEFVDNTFSEYELITLQVDNKVVK